MMNMLDTQQVIEQVLRSMGLTWKKIEVTKGFFDKELVYMIRGGNAFLLTKGRSSDGLAAFNHIIHTLLEKKSGTYSTDISIDVDDHRQQKITSLCEEVDSIIPTITADYLFRPLTAFERKVVHQHVQTTYPHIKTVSEGEGLERRLKLLSVN